MQPLAPQLRPCGPVFDAGYAERTLAALAPAAARDGWGDALEAARPALAPVFGASPYLAGLARRAPERLRLILEEAPAARLGAILAATEAVADDGDAPAALRRLKGDLHLLTALADLGGAWDLDAVTAALTDFADAATRKALHLAAAAEVRRGTLAPEALAPETLTAARGPLPGLFALAMGKHGAGELNYSSDIDLTVFFDPDALPVAGGADPHVVAQRATLAMAKLLQERTGEGYVFRVDLRLRPDPSATPSAVPVDSAIGYYESVGQNWERAAFIKARPCAGDLAAGEAFLAELVPFIWRRHLDFAAIADIQAIKQQIHAFKTDERLTAPGVDLKLGRGGIREVEFYAQTQQLILGGRDPALRSRRTREALTALAEAGHVTAADAAALCEAYVTLRALEHRVQMVADEQTHRLPVGEAERRRVACLSAEATGARTLRGFDAAVTRTLKTVNRRYGALFAEAEPLSSRYGSLVFTGVEDDPETLATLARMGFSEPARISETIRAWHHGRIAATRTARGRELFTRLAPRLLEACRATGSPDAAFRRFSTFFAGLSSGVQIQSLFLAQEPLLQLVVRTMAFAPRLAAVLGRRPSALDALLDEGFHHPLTEEDAAAVCQAARGLPFEPAMDAVRRAQSEQAFRIGVQLLGGAITAEGAGQGFAALAVACIQALAPAALAEVERTAGAFPGAVAVVALGKCGSREMTARSDLDLMTVYRADAPAAASALKGWGAETVYARFTQRLVAALSAPTAAGGLYEVDLRLRPTGTAGPVAVSLPALQAYYAGEAETWEHLALTRASVVWSDREGFADEVTAAIAAALRQPRDPAATAGDVRDMRGLMRRERPPKGPWDVKLGPGGLVDIEFAAQHLQLLHAAEGGPLRPNTGDALEAMRAAGLAQAAVLDPLLRAWRLQQDVTQFLRLSLEDDGDPEAEPAPFRLALARAAGRRSFAALKRDLAAAQGEAHAAFQAVTA